MALTFASRVIRRVSREWNNIRIERLQRRHSLPEIPLNDVIPGVSAIKPPIMDDICMPPYYGFDDHDDYAPLMHIATRLDPKVVVELGTAYGNTIANLCRHCPRARFYTVNAPVSQQTGEVVTFELQESEIGRVYRQSGDEGRVTQIFANTLQLDLGQYLAGSFADLGIVDACHDEAFVVNDFVKMHPFIRKGGIVLLHDTHASMQEHLKGSYVACMRLRKMGFDIKHITDSWWGVWVKP